MRKFLKILLVPIILLAASGPGDYLTSEEEILDALAKDEINFTQYYDLLELFREKISVFGSDLDRLLIVPGVDKRWIDALGDAVAHAGPYATQEQVLGFFPFDFDRIDAFIIFDKPTKRDWKAGAKVYSHGRFIDDDQYYPKTYYTIDGGYKTTDIGFRLHEDADGLRCRRRAFETEVLDGELAIGSYRAGFGPGLVLGKAFYIPGDERENTLAESFVNPQDNMFNGIRFERQSEKIGVGILSSRIVYDSVAASALGAMILWNPIEELDLGGVYGYGDARARPGGAKFRQSSGSVFARGEWNDTEIESELGLVENGGAGFMTSVVTKVEKTRALAEIWSYANNFNPMNAKGLSDYKQTYIEFDESGITQRSREAGESGFEIRTTTLVASNVFLDLEESGWRTPQIEDWGIYSEIGLNYRGENGKRIRGDYSFEKRYNSDDFREKQTIRAIANWPLPWHCNVSGYFRFRRTTTNDERYDGLSVYPEITCNRFEPVVLKLRAKRYKSRIDDPDNGYWELRFRDEIRTGPILWIGEVRHARYDDPGDDPLTEFRLTTAYYWR